MKEKFTAIIVLALFCSFGAFAQATKYNFTYAKAFPDTNFRGALGGHGVVVTPDGRIWLQKYSPSDSIRQASGTYIKVSPLYVFNPDGSQAPFSPIRTIALSGVNDTLVNSGRGLDKDNQGNVLAAYFDKVYRVNYKTGAGINAVIEKASQTMIKPAADSLGEVFTGPVIPGAMPIVVWDNVWSNLGNVQDTTAGYSRALGVNSNGNDVYFCSYSPKYVLRIHSDNGSLGPYNKRDTLFSNKLAVESITWHPKTKYLWVSSGNAFAPSNTPGFTDYSFYAFVPPNFTTPVDSFRWKGNWTNFAFDPRPRGISFSPTGDTVIVCQFDDPNSEIAQMFVKGVTAVQPVDNLIPKVFSMSQNYPNPFNPSTTVKFTLPAASTITLKVYDVLGREVATLAQGQYAPGDYSAVFDAKSVNSGVYFYTLHTSTGFTQTSKMLLMK